MSRNQWFSHFFHFVRSVSGDVGGALQAGRHHVFGPRLRQRGKLCKGKPFLLSPAWCIHWHPGCLCMNSDWFLEQTVESSQDVSALQSCSVPAHDKRILCSQVKSFEKDRQSEKRIPESDVLDHIIQKCRTKFFEERNIRWINLCNVWLSFWQL